jgi:osmoprotectant transport system ATP-binding protein
MINGLVTPDQGMVTIGGEDIRSMNLKAARKDIGYVIQAVGLMPHYTVEQNIAMGCRLKGFSAAECNKRVRNWMDKTGLPTSLLGKKPSELSGGQAQRVGIARALAADPSIVLLDEPFSALDPLIRKELQIEFRALQRQMNFTAVMVTHDLTEAIMLADKILLIADHQIQQMGSPQEIVFQSMTPHVNSFLSGNRLEAELAACKASDLGLGKEQDISVLELAQKANSEEMKDVFNRFFEWKETITKQA